MGAFVLGVLTGWLAEWLYFTFWIKPNEVDNDCSALKAELELKNKQISSLQSQLDSSSKDAASRQSKAGSTAKKASDIKSTKTNTKTVAKKATKPASKKTTAATKATAKKPATRKSKTKSGVDDLTKISGIGPSMAATLQNLGIDSYKKLASTDDDILRDMLEASGARMNNNKEAMDSWNEQAAVAAKGDFAALKSMQAKLKR